MSLEQALSLVKAAGYRVSKPKTKETKRHLNAIGRPYSPLFDPNYKMKYRTSLAFLTKPMPKDTPWVRS